MGDKNYSDLLDGLVTLISIIIGFLGAMLPIVLSLKENSEFVQYIFKEDREKLFYKYMKEMFLYEYVMQHYRCFNMFTVFFYKDIRCTCIIVGFLLQLHFLQLHIELFHIC